MEPPLIPINEKDIQVYLDRENPGQSKYVTQRKENDIVEILSGTFEGKTTGHPIALHIKNMKIKEVKIILKFLLNLDQDMLTLHIKTNMELEIIEEEADQAQEKQL